MAEVAKRDQVLTVIGAAVAAELLVMHLEVCMRAAILTGPAVALQDALAQIAVCSVIQVSLSH
jgi:hypothetical protein